MYGLTATIVKMVFGVVTFLAGILFLATWYVTQDPYALIFTVPLMVSGASTFAFNARMFRYLMVDVD